jgi:hypothetical protein
MYPHFLKFLFIFPTGGAKLPRAVGAPTSGFSYADSTSRGFYRSGGGRPLHSAQSLIFRYGGGGRLLRKIQFLIFSNPTVDLAIRSAISSPVVLLRVSLTFPVLSLGVVSSDIAAVRRLDPSLPFCLRGASTLSGSLAHPWLWSTYSWRCSCCSMPLLHGGTPSYRRQPTSSRIHNLLGPVPLALRVALQLHASPCAASSLLPKISLRPPP